MIKNKVSEDEFYDFLKLKGNSNQKQPVQYTNCILFFCLIN